MCLKSVWTIFGKNLIKSNLVVVSIQLKRIPEKQPLQKNQRYITSFTALITLVGLGKYASINVGA
jgi:hypothetical protein